MRRRFGPNLDQGRGIDCFIAAQKLQADAGAGSVELMSQPLQYCDIHPLKVRIEHFPITGQAEAV
jgi:hypothetical protein